MMIVVIGCQKLQLPTEPLTQINCSIVQLSNRLTRTQRGQGRQLDQAEDQSAFIISNSLTFEQYDEDPRISV